MEKRFNSPVESQSKPRWMKVCKGYSQLKMSAAAAAGLNSLHVSGIATIFMPGFDYDSLEVLGKISLVVIRFDFSTCCLCFGKIRLVGNMFRLALGSSCRCSAVSFIRESQNGSFHFTFPAIAGASLLEPKNGASHPHSLS